MDFIPTKDWQVIRIPCMGVAPKAAASSEVSTWIVELRISDSPSEFALEIDEIRSD